MHLRSFLIPSLALLALPGAIQAAEDLQIHGLVSQGFFLTKDNAMFTPRSENNGTFEFNELALNVVATPIDRLRVGIQVAAQDLGNSFNNKPTIDWAYGNYNFGEVADGLQVAVSAGRFKMGHGLFNDYRDLDMTRTSVFLPMSVYNPRWRDILLAVNGVGLTFGYDAGPLGNFELNGYLGNNNYSASEGPLYDTFSDTGMAPSSISHDSLRGGQLTWNTPLEGLRLKYSLLNAEEFAALGTYNRNAAGNPGDFVFGTDFNFTIANYWENIWSLEYQWNDLVVTGEYNYTFFHGLVEGTYDIGAVNIPVSVDQTTATHATYINAAYRVHPKWEIQGGWQWAREYDSAPTKWYALNAAVRYDITDHWLIKAEYQWTHGHALLRAAEQPDGTREKIWSFIAVKTTFDF